jgi:dienelactone hydrolase
MKTLLAAMMFGLWAACAAAQQEVSIPVAAGPDQGAAAHLPADLYRGGERGIILAHGGRFNKESWKKQAEVLVRDGFTVLAINFRGDTVRPDGTPSAMGSDEDNATDVLAAAAYLRAQGMKAISAIGGSLGGDAVGEADARSPAGAFECVVFLGSAGGDAPEKLTGRKLFIVARDDKSGSELRLPEISKHYAQAPEPKKLVVLDGSAHAQYLFDTEQGPRLMDEIQQFVLAK